MVGISLLITVVVIVGLRVSSDETVKPQPMNEPKTFSSAEHRVSLAYSATAQTSPISEQDEADGIFFRAQQAVDPEYLITLRVESGLRTPAQLAGMRTLDLVVNGALSSLPTRYPEYSLLSEGGLEVDGTAAHQITFSYRGPSGIIAKQRLVLIAVNEDKALYLSMQSQNDDFETLDATFTALQLSLNLQQ